MFDFQRCTEILEIQAKYGFDKKRIGNNTYLRRLNDKEFAIALHQTDVVVVFERNGQTVFRLNSGGYKTTTTKDRLNTLTPARIYQKRGVWYLNEDGYTGDGKNDVVYFDGIEVDEQGRVINNDSAPPHFLKKKKILDRLINEYIRGFAKDALENGLGKPDSGGCLLCTVYAGKHEQDSAEHICSHLYEKYYTPNFLYYCLKIRNYSNPSLIWVMMARDCEQGRDEALKRELRYGFGKMQDKLLKVFSIEEYEAVLAEQKEMQSVA